MKILNIIKFIFTIVGVGMLVGTFFMYKSTADFLKNAQYTFGVVVDLRESRRSDTSSSSTYAPVVRFTDNLGKQVEFTSPNSSNPPSYDVNEAVEVLYVIESPQNAKINGFFSLWGGAVILGALGSVFASIGLVFFVYDIRKKKKEASLKLNGTRIETDFVNVAINSSLAVNDRNPFMIVSQWQNPATSKLHIFESDNIWFDPTSFIKTDKIKVWIDRNNPKKYHVDISFLPEVED